MFYKQLLKICNFKNVKPTPVLKEIGLSPGNLKRWETGSNVNYDTLDKLSQHFDVPVDYFFEDEKFVPNSERIILEGFPFKFIFNILKAHPDHIVSLMAEEKISRCDLERVSKYLNCLPQYLIKNDNIIIDSGVSNDVIPPKDLVLNILSKLAANEEYRYLQVCISNIIIGHLKKKNITSKNLIEIGLVEKKIRNLCDSNIPDEKKTGLNYSDLMNISEKFKVSYDFMFTGIGD